MVRNPDFVEAIDKTRALGAAVVYPSAQLINRMRSQLAAPIDG